MKIQQLLPLVFLAAFLGACRSDTNNPVATAALTPAQQQAKIEQLKLDYHEPVLIDSSVYVMYPLRLGYTEDEDTDSSMGSKSYSRSNTYWNIVFYNTETGESHLLSTDKRMIIYAYSEEKSGDETTTISAAEYAKYAKSGVRQLGKRLYYSVRTTDFNQDGVIDDNDPTYLFTSDKAGLNFSQISPANYNVAGSQAVKGADKLLIQGSPDTNGDKIFNGQDISTPLIYSLRSDGPAKAVFSAPFNAAAKQLLHSQWANKP